MIEIMSGKGPILMLVLLGAVLFQADITFGQGGQQSMSEMHKLLIYCIKLYSVCMVVYSFNISSYYIYVLATARHTNKGYTRLHSHTCR